MYTTRKLTNTCIDVAFYDGDILMLYACYGLLLIPISYLPLKAVWCIVGLLAIQPVELDGSR